MELFRLKGESWEIVPNHSAFRKQNPLEPEKRPLRLFKLTRLSLYQLQPIFFSLRQYTVWANNKPSQ